MAPANTPGALVNALNTEANRMLQKSEIRERLEGLGADPAGGSPKDLARHLADETSKWKKIVQLSGARADQAMCTERAGWNT